MNILGTLRRLAGNRLTQKQKLVLRRIAELKSEVTMSSLLRRIAREENMGESTARVVIQALRSIGLVECGTAENKGVPVRITPIGRVVLQNPNGCTIDELRKKINLVDSLLLELIAERLEIAKDIGRAKQKANLGVTDRQREKIVKLQWLEAAESRGLDTGCTRLLLRSLTAMSKEVQ